MLRVELAELRKQLTARNSELAELRAQCRSLSEHAATAKSVATDMVAQLETAHAALEKAKDAHSQEFAAVHARYEGLSRQLLQETAHQRHTFQVERERLTGQVAQASERVAALEGLRERLLAELSAERDAHRQAAAEAAALTSVVSGQRIALQATRRPGLRTARPPAANPPGRPARPGMANAANTARMPRIARRRPR